MSALARNILNRLAELGAKIERKGDKLLLEAGDLPIPGGFVATIKAHKIEVLQELVHRAKPRDPWCGESYRALYEGRAGIAEHVGGQPRAKTEAYESVLAHWWNDNPAASNPNLGCVWCGKPDAPDKVIVPYGIGPHVWLHHACWPSWSAARRADAIAALDAVGISAPPDEEKNFKDPR